MYLFGGNAIDVNSDFKVLDLPTNKWSVHVVPKTKCCPVKDDHASYYDAKSDSFYVFGGYINSDKTNDLWKFDFT